MTTSASVSVLIGAELGSAFKSAFSSAGKSVSALGTTIKALEDKSSKITSFRSINRELKEASIAYNLAKQKVNQLSAEVSKTDKPSRELVNNLRKSQRELTKAKTHFSQTAQTSREMGKALQSAGIDIKSLNKQSQSLSNSLEILRKRQTALQNIENVKAKNLANRANYRHQMMDVLALGTAMYSTIKPAVDFEYAMAKVGAITNESANGEGFKNLTNLARKLGRETQYTASEVASAMQYLGMAGFNTNQILEATPAALNLAIAGSLDIGRTADIASNILTGFNLKATETTRVADVLAQTSRSTNVNIEMLGETMKYVAPAAASVGGSLEEVSALAGVLGDAGIQGTMAGTMLRSAYLKLAAPASKGADALASMGESLGLSKDELSEVSKEAMLTQAHLSNMGVRVFDSSGKMRSMIDILRDMSVALKNASDQDKLASVKAIFGDRAASGALAIFKHIETGRLDEVIGKVKTAEGSAQEMADRLKNTTVGSFKELKSAVESVGISIGTLLLPSFTSFARGLASVTNRLTTFSEKFPVLTKYVGLAVSSLMGLKISSVALGYGFTFFKGGVLTIIGIFTKLRTALTIIKIGMTSVRALAIANGFATFGKSIIGFVGSAIPMLIAGIKGIGLALVSNPIGLIITAIVTGGILIMKYWEPIKGFFGSLWQGIKEGANSVWNSICKIVEPIKKVKDLVGSAWNWLFGKNEDKNKPSSQPEEVVKKVKTKDLTTLNSKAKDVVNKSSQNTYVTTANISIHTTPGMSEKVVAEEVKKALEYQEQKTLRTKRSLNLD